MIKRADAKWSLDHDGQMIPAPDEATALLWARESRDDVYRRGAGGEWELAHRARDIPPFEYARRT